MNDNNELLFKLNLDKNSYSVIGIEKKDATNIIIPSIYQGLAVTTIADHAFFECNTLKSIEIPDSVTIIEHDAFNRCKSLENVIIGNNVTIIKEVAFGLCNSLKIVKIPSSVKHIENCAFFACIALESVTIGKNVTRIDDGAFFACFSMLDVYYEGSKEDFENIIISPNNECLTNATIHFNS